MSEYIHMNHGNDAEYDKVMELLNTSFSFKKDFDKFQNLLPKLYKPEYKPASNNIVLDVNGEMRAAVGLYYGEMSVCGETLKTGGIGNVAVHPDYRGAGYMRFCMAYCLDEMKQNMTDYSFLCGRRQRYEHFSYEPAGIRYEFKYTKTNALKKNIKKTCEAREITPEDADTLKEIYDIYNSRNFKAQRPLSKMYDILVSWKGKPYGVFEKGEFKGWFVFNSSYNYVYETFYKDADSIEQILISALSVAEKFSGENSGTAEITIAAPEFDVPLTQYLSLYCEEYSVNHPDQFNIFCYENVIRAFLKLKSTYKNLADGECVLFIDGSKLPEKIKITVKDNTVNVEETDEKPDIVLSHPEAMRLVGSIYSEKRNLLPAPCSSWFPLPLFTYEQDNV